MTSLQYSQREVHGRVIYGVKAGGNATSGPVNDMETVITPHKTFEHRTITILYSLYFEKQTYWLFVFTLETSGYV